VRQYSYQISDASVEALRLLRDAWAGYRVEPRAFTVVLADRREVRIVVERADVEPDFEATRLAAAVDATDAAATTARMADPIVVAHDFAVGRNDVVLFTGATWLEGPPASASDGDGGGASAAILDAAWPGQQGDRSVQFSGHPGQLSEHASVVCLTTDALVVASPVGTGFLVRTGIKPLTVEVSDDAGEIARFLAERGYAGT
jgi:hypothetical protein